VDVGTPVIAPADGKVTEIRSFDGPRPWQGGWVVQVTHAEDFHSAYLHLTELHVEMGKSVKRGQLIGLSGASNSGHAHLHFGACAMSAGRANLDRAGAGDEEAGVIRPKGLTVRPVTLNSAAPRWRFWDSALGELIRESTGLEK